MIIVLVCVLLTIACAGWAWWHQQRALHVLTIRPSHVAHAQRRAGLTTPVGKNDRPVATTAATPPAVARVSVAVARRAPEPVSSVLGWEAFAIASTMVLDGTVLIGCRRRNHNRGGPETATLVLLIGDDERANRAVALLEGWSVTDATLGLRPTHVAGAIELYDQRRNALRAGILAA
jgi:hypothetical protein